MSETTNDPISDAAQDWFLRMSSDVVTQDTIRNFEAWRAADPRHRAAYDEVRTLWNDIGPLRAAFAPKIGVVRVPAPVIVKPRRIGRRAFVAGGLIAASLMLFVAGPSQIAARLTADEWTAIGQQASVPLPDGSIAYLNTDSAIDIDYSGVRRRVTVRYGEALFEVQRNSTRPFDVIAADGTTTAVGTAFIVKTQGHAASVSVTEGQVSVSSPARSDADGGGRGDGVLVSAGQTVRYRSGARPRTVRDLDIGAATAWRSGAIAIRDLTLSEAVAEIGRYRPGRIVVMGDTSNHKRVTARISLADIDSGLDALAATQGLTVARYTDYLVVLH